MEITLIPQSAPFNAEQRAWLNGFLAGWIGLAPSGMEAASIPAPASLAKSAAPPPVVTEPVEPEPWHDPALGIGDRLALAGGKALPKRLMAAMAQLDCGSCGYVCRTYAEAIANGSEQRLSLCSPGGSATAKAVKALLRESAETVAPAPITNGAATNGAPKAALNGWSRENPFPARLLRAQRLSGEGSEKQTHHIEIKLEGGPTYNVGDSLGVYPENCGDLVQEIVTTLGAEGTEPVVTPEGATTTLRDALSAHCCLSSIEDTFLDRLAESHPEQAPEIRAGDIDDDAPIAGFDVLDLLRRHPVCAAGRRRSRRVARGLQAPALLDLQLTEAASGTGPSDSPARGRSPR